MAMFMFYAVVGDEMVYGIPATVYETFKFGHRVKWAAEREKPFRTIYVRIKNKEHAVSYLVNNTLIAEYREAKVEETN